MARYVFTAADRAKAALSRAANFLKRVVIRERRSKESAAQMLAAALTKHTGVLHTARVITNNPEPFTSRVDIGAVTPIDYLTLSKALKKIAKNRKLRKAWANVGDIMMGVSVFDPKIGKWVGTEEDAVTLGHAEAWEFVVNHSAFEADDLASAYAESQVYALVVWTL